jgi:hypothetical protein
MDDEDALQEWRTERVLVHVYASWRSTIQSDLNCGRNVAIDTIQTHLRISTNGGLVAVSDQLVDKASAILSIPICKPASVYACSCFPV